MHRNSLQQIFRAAHFPVEKYGSPHWKITQEIIGELRVLSYVDQWRRALYEEWFHVKLEDHSLLIFSDVPDRPSFSFLHCPIAVEPFRIYLNRRGVEFNARNRAIYAEEYEMEFETAELKRHVTPIRYDVDSNGYRTGVHPAAHIHIGLDNNVRIAVRREMTPLSFTLFVMRQMYPECWAKLLERREQFRLQGAIRDGLQLVQADYWKENDGLELHLV